MDLIDEIRAIASRIPKQLEHLKTEEATKNALVMPFISALGYNIFDPMEVVPEFNADIGVKKFEKVDYAIIKDDKPIMLFECKSAHTNLNEEHASQLYRYFTVTAAKFGILTNGIAYRFYTDLDEPNRMDQKPFLEFNLLDSDYTLVEELKRFTKSVFNLDSILEAASELLYTKEIKRILAHQLREPSEDFVRFFVTQIYVGRFTHSVREQFTPLTKLALNQFINERINDRLKSAIAIEGQTFSNEKANVLAEKQIAEPIVTDAVIPLEGERVVTSQEELEGYQVVKEILHGVVDEGRIAIRDVGSYCGILLDDTRLKPICRLWFNRPQKYVSIFDTQRHEQRMPIASVSEIRNYADQLKQTVMRYDGFN